MYYNNITELIGSTPIVKLNNLMKKENLHANIFAKVEFFNPGGSIKDRISKAMIENLEAKGLINEDTIIYEPTSGNTGIGAALVGAAKSYKVVIVMPSSVSVERIQIIKAYGAEVILTDKKFGMKGAIAKVEELMQENPNSVTLSQFENEVNPQQHSITTGIEIYDDLEGNVDILVAGVGTGGTITGVGTYLKSQNANIEVVAVEPKSSQVLKGEEANPHKIQGIGAGFVPNVLDTNIYDLIISISDDEAMKTTRLLAQNEGIFCGISSGAALYAAIQLAKDPENANKNIVVILPDTGERYLSTEVFA